ncbi:MAG: UDP-3-O-acyl-N-acetylglucosamine deacetylase [bacterium]
MNFQKTIESEITISGISLHLGLESCLTFKPAPPNTGIIFTRTDIASSPIIKAVPESAVEGVIRQTSIGNQDAMIHTIEHVMAALAGLQIDNIIIETNSPEPPAMDGSSLPFIHALQKAGIVNQNVPRSELKINEIISVSDNDKKLMIIPDEKCRITYTYGVDKPIHLTQSVSLDIDENSFISEIAPARTFCFQHEIETLKAKGFGKGGNKENVVVINDDGTSDQPPRLDNEMARHKILDLLGDLYLLGCIPKAHIIGIKSGHELNTKLVRKIAESNKRNIRMERTETTETLGVNEIKNILPHRYPFLLVDRVIKLEEDKMAVGIKNVTINEGFFQGHFPDLPIMPGVLQIEALAQVAGILLFRNKKENNSLGYFRSIENVKFRRPVVPGDQLRLEVQMIKKKGNLAKFSGQVSVDNQVITEAEFTIAF